MNAQHPIRALHGHLAVVAPSIDAPPPAHPLTSYERGLGSGQLLVGLSGIDSMLEGLTAMAWHIERGIRDGAGQDYDREKLEHIAGRLAEIHQKLDMSAGRLTAKLAGAR